MFSVLSNPKLLYALIYQLLLVHFTLLNSVWLISKTKGWRVGDDVVACTMIISEVVFGCDWGYLLWIAFVLLRMKLIPQLKSWFWSRGLTFLSNNIHQSFLIIKCSELLVVELLLPSRNRPWLLPIRTQRHRWVVLRLVPCVLLMITLLPSWCFFIHAGARPRIHVWWKRSVLNFRWIKHWFEFLDGAKLLNSWLHLI